EQSEPLYEYFVHQIRNQGLEVETGQFGAMMDISLTNTGPFTLVIDSDDLAAPRRGYAHWSCSVPTPHLRFSVIAIHNEKPSATHDWHNIKRCSVWARQSLRLRTKP